jgi:hypothetical protein
VCKTRKLLGRFWRNQQWLYYTKWLTNTIKGKLTP